jgi:hypothetical protein
MPGEKEVKRQGAIHSLDEEFYWICFMDQKGQQPDIFRGCFMRPVR